MSVSVRFLHQSYSAQAVSALWKSFAVLLCLIVWLSAAPMSAQGLPKDPATPQATLDVPDYQFDHEELRPMYWRNPYSRRAYLAYLVLDSNGADRQRRALVLVDSIENASSAFFLEGSKLRPVPEVPGKPIRDRIDKSLSLKSALTNAVGAVTINISQSSARTQLRFASALEKFSSKFQKVPCLTLPDIVSLSREGRITEFVALLKHAGLTPDFGPLCGKFPDDLAPPAFAYIDGPRLRFASSKKRLVLLSRNFAISIPYALDDNAIVHSSFLISGAQLEKILAELRDLPQDSDASSRESSKSVRQQTFRVQRDIDARLEAILRMRGEVR